MVFEFDTKECKTIADSRIREISNYDRKVIDACNLIYEKIRYQIHIRAVITDNVRFDGDYILFNNAKIKCPVLKQLANIYKIYAYVLTVNDLECEGETFVKTACDMWGTAFCDAACMVLKDRVESLNPKHKVSDPIGPGFYGISASTIPAIFDGVGGSQIGISIENGFLKPPKSSIGFFVVADTELNAKDCINCTGDTNCIYCKNYKKTVTVNFVSENIKISVPQGITISDAINRAGIKFEQPCGGMGKCGKCRVDVIDTGTQKTVLACKTKIYSNVEIILPKTDNEIIIKRVSDIRGGNYSLAIDIGTTTVCMSVLCDNEVVLDLETINPQTIHCADVIGRIAFARDNTQVLHNEITECINKMIEKAKSELNTESIKDAVITGNTVMQYILQGENPKALGEYPYTVNLKSAKYTDAKSIGINIDGRVYLPDNISAFVGSDIVCGIAHLKLWERDRTLFLDIGTNGEMAVFKDGKLYTASASAGPAFEGMNITFGMRAYDGAISKFDIVNSIASITTIGQKPVKGICGTGLIDIVYGLLKNGIILADGTFAKKEECMSRLRSRLCEYKGETAFMLSNDVYLTQSDIRELQLAKSAIRSGIELMANGVSNIIISGAFGKNVRIKSLAGVGILPERFLNKTEVLSNTAILGAIDMYRHTELRKTVSDKIKNGESVSFSDNSEFKKLFIKHLNFEV